MPLRQLVACMRGLVRDPASMIATTNGHDGWTRSEHLLALAVDELRIANWQRSKSGQKNKNRPKPISPLTKKRGQRTGRVKKGKTPQQVMAALAKYGPAEKRAQLQQQLDEGGGPDGH